MYMETFHISKWLCNILYVLNAGGKKKKNIARHQIFDICVVLSTPTSLFSFNYLPDLSLWNCLSLCYILQKDLSVPIF